MKTIPSLIFLLILTANFYLQAEVKCTQCHTCPVPSIKNPCLKSCPRDKSAAYHATGPDVVFMDKISQLYVPVVFSHKLHAEMSGISAGCILCHHHESIINDQVKPCQACHETSPKKSDLRKPGLKGAYHRQCLGCHREWSHTTKCVVCHALKSSETTPVAIIADSTDIMGKSHPKIEAPDKLIYETSYEEAKLVTFYHNEHVDRFGFKCADCHKQESCGTCHDLEKSKQVAQIGIDQASGAQTKSIDSHTRCAPCHTMESCADCHDHQSKQPFNHQKRTGWALKKYHQKVSCSGCHGDKKTFSRVNLECQNCHKNWSVETFDHAVTGLVLDDAHKESDCENCHIDNHFTKRPTCDNCHDDITFPENKPGRPKI
jgi:hypothetical protein